MNKLIFIISFAGLFITTTYSKQVDKRYSFVPATFQAKVEQVVTTILTGKVKKTYGTIDYRYPGQFKYEQDKPSHNKVIFVSNRKKSWLYRAPFKKEPGSLTINPLRGTFSFSEFFDLLSNGLSSNKMYDVKKIKGVYHLAFTQEYRKKLGFKKAIMTFKNKVYYSFDNLRSVEITKNDNSKVTFNMIKIKRNLKFEKKHFVFTPPPNTKIMK